MPFTLRELADISLTLRDVCIGLVELAYHDTKPALTSDYCQVIKSVQDPSVVVEDSDLLAEQVHHWQKLFKATVNLLRQLHTRDARRPFCPPGHWISKQVRDDLTTPMQYLFTQQFCSITIRFVSQWKDHHFLDQGKIHDADSRFSPESVT